MSGLAATARVVAVRDRAASAEPSHALRLALRVAAFAALCAYAALHWGRLVTPAAGGHMLAATAVATAGAAAIGAVNLTAERLPRGAAPAIKAALALATFAAALLAVGLPVRYLAPAHWGDLRDGIDRGLTGTSTITWPYAAGDPWIRLTILLGLPAVATASALAAFAPRGRRSAAAGGAAGLILLVGLYAFAVTEVGLGAHVVRGIVLLLLIAAWLWLPHVRRRDAAAALAVVIATGLLAVPIANTLDASEPWIHWEQWSWFSSRGGEGFQWDHQYGPFTWPRTGRLVLDVKAPHPHYWKAETLDRFDGERWMHSGQFLDTDVRNALPDRLNPRWIETISVADRDLRSDVVIGAGTIFRYDGGHAVATTADGTTSVVDGSIGRGESYDVHAYVPDPSAAQMRAAPLVQTDRLLPFVEFELPSRTLRQVPQVVGLAPWNASQTAPGSIDTSRVMASPYRRVYLLARSLAAGERTAYDVVKRIQGYLEQHYTYDEQPPVRPYPLEAFLFRDKIGYCQQFSGAMALMLRMDGIPARVAAGFAPGDYDATAREYHVRDLDAHSWVEVWFDGIGWVPFDPTPSVAPASLQSAGTGSASAANGDVHDKGSTPSTKKAENVPPSRDVPQGPEPNRVRIAIGVVAGFAALAGLAAWLLATLRVRRLRRHHDDPELAELTAALSMLGYRVAPGTTLAQLERRLRAVAGDGAARYAHLLRDERFAPGAHRGPTATDRRALRSALTGGRGLRARVKGFLALPPGRPRFRAS